MRLKKVSFTLLFICLFFIWPSRIATPSLRNREVNLFQYSGDGRLVFKNLHLDEVLEVKIKDPKGNYLQDALSRVDHILRDRLTQEQTSMSVKLLELLDHIQDHFGGGEIDVISGYRSPELNSQLRAAGHGVASRSLHMEGLAIDFRIPGVPTRLIRDYAVSLKAGGVGYYAGSDFVHIDVGRVRYW